MKETESEGRRERERERERGGGGGGQKNRNTNSDKQTHGQADRERIMHFFASSLSSPKQINQTATCSIIHSDRKSCTRKKKKKKKKLGVGDK